MDDLGRLLTRDSVRRKMGSYMLDRQVGIGGGDDERTNAFAESLVRGAHDGRLLHALQQRENVLHLARGDVLSTANDHILFAVDDRQIVVAIKRADIACAQPSCVNALAFSAPSR